MRHRSRSVTIENVKREIDHARFLRNTGEQTLRRIFCISRFWHSHLGSDLVVITVVGFIAGFVWRVSHIPRDRRQQGLDS